MKCELLMIGTEMLLGQIVDTNAAYMAQMLAENGVDLYQKTTVGDNPERIKAALSAALDRADVVISSGGLGPTEDDITRDCIAELLGRPLEFREDLMQVLEARFRAYGATMTDNNKRQACAPRDGIAIENPNGTAPGLIVEDARGVIISMPGVPQELKPMLVDKVIPYIRQKFGFEGVILSRVLKVCAIGESRVDAAISDLILESSNPTIGLLAGPEATRIRVTAKADSSEQAAALIDVVETKIRERLHGLIMGVGEDITIEGVVDALLRSRGWTLAAGGTTHAAMLVQKAASLGEPTFAGGTIYPALPNRPEVVARELARNCRADCALLVTGDSVGSLIQFYSAARAGAKEESVAWPLPFAGTSGRVQTRLAVAALEHLRRHLILP